MKFIEFLAGIDGKLQPQIYGVSAFKENADDLYEVLEKKNNGRIDDGEAGYGYGFLEISVGICRQRMPQDVQEMIEEAQEEGNPMDAEDMSDEMRKASHWDTIGIGVRGYYG